MQYVLIFVISVNAEETRTEFTVWGRVQVIEGEHFQGGDSSPADPGCVGSNWREMELLGHGGRETVSPFMGLEGLHLYGCVSREFTTIWVCF